MKTLSAGPKEMVGSAKTRHSMVRKALLTCGILAALVWMGTDIFAGLRYEGYNYPFDPISGLSAVGAPTRQLVASVGAIFTILKIAFACGIWMSAAYSRPLKITAGLLFTSGFADVAASFFPWDPSDSLGTFTNIMHGILAGVVAMPAFMLSMGFGARAGGKWFRFYSYGALLVLIVSGAVMAFLDAPRMEANLLETTQAPPLFGLIERIIGYGFMVWVIVLAVVLLRDRSKA